MYSEKSVKCQESYSTNIDYIINNINMEKEFIILTIANIWLTSKLLAENIKLYILIHN